MSLCFNVVKTAERYTAINSVCQQACPIQALVLCAMAIPLLKRADGCQKKWAYPISLNIMS